MEKLRLYAATAVRDVYKDGVVIGKEEYSFTVEIDEKSLRAMGGRAARNSTSRAQRGGMVAKVTSRRAI